MPSAPVGRPFSFRLPMSEAERGMFQELVEDSGMTAAAFIRQILKREHAKRFGETPPVRLQKKGKK